MYNRSTQDAISAISYLAEIYDGGDTTCSSAEIAEKRNLPKPFVAKLLTYLSQARLVTGSRGPGGGYTLAKPPKEISFKDVAKIFEREDDELSCPYGRGQCGKGENCPVHDQLEAIRNSIQNFLAKTRFDTFQKKKKAAKK